MIRKNKKRKYNTSLLFINYFKPSLYLESVNKININSLKNSGIKLIICDLENTLIRYSETTPTHNIKKFIKDIELNNIKLILFSNSSRKRVENFAKIVGIKNYFWNVKKPLLKMPKLILKKFKYNPSEILVIGDQIIVDVFMANRCNFKSVLVKPLSKIGYDNVISGYLEKKVISKLEQNNILHEDFFTEGMLSDSYDLL